MFSHNPNNRIINYCLWEFRFNLSANFSKVLGRDLNDPTE